MQIADFKTLKYNNVEVIRFLFSIAIVYFHILHSNIMKFAQKFEVFDLYNVLAIKSSDAGLIVECFFIIAGFFLFKSITCNKEQSWINFAVNKITRLWPVLAFSILCTCLLAVFGIIKTNYYTQFVNLFFLQCIGVTLDYKGINWYIAPFFWIILFYSYILKTFKIKAVNLIIALLIYISLVANINYYSGGFGRETFAVILNSGILRAFACIGIGYFIGTFYLKFVEYFNTQWTGIKSTIIVSLLEITSCAFLLNHFLFNKINYSNKLIFIIVFSIFFLLLLLRKGILSKALDNKHVAMLGKYAYSIYVMQQVSFYLLMISLWKIEFIVKQPLICFGLSIIFSTLIGILVYYFIEIPGRNLFKNITQDTKDNRI